MLRLAFPVLCLLCAAPALAQGIVPEEPVSVVDPEAPFTLRAGIALPEAEVVRHRGRAYAVRFVPGGGFGYSRKADGATGAFRTDLFLVAGTEDKMRAVAVYMKFCHGSREVVDAWGDEPVRKLAGTGEWAFMYPEDCPAWRASHG